jgi:hypothetical protein
LALTLTFWKCSVPLVFFTSDANRKIVDCVWRSWTVVISCDGCRNSTEWGVDALITVGQIAMRLRCSCGSREGRITSRTDVAAQQRRDIAKFSAENKFNG